MLAEYPLPTIASLVEILRDKNSLMNLITLLVENSWKVEESENKLTNSNITPYISGR